MNRGFSTLEMMIALAILTLVLTSVVLVTFGAGFWSAISETATDALYQAETKLEEVRALSRQNFYEAVSEPLARVDTAECLAGGLCFYVAADVSDVSECAKGVSAVVAWHVGPYPTTTSALYTKLASPEIGLALGGDCLLDLPEGEFGSLSESASGTFSPGTPVALDALSELTYVAASASPFLRIADASGTFVFSFAGTEPFNALDVARDAGSGRIYAYLARATTTEQFEIVDVTDSASPASLSTLSLAGVSASGSFPQGWRVHLYDRVAYVVTRDTTGPELHIIDVSNPVVPDEFGSGTELSTSVYGLLVRDQFSGGSVRRFLYLATTHDSEEVRVFDVTDPFAVSEVVGARTDLPGSKDGRSLHLHGTTLLVGLESGSGDDLYALDASDPLSAAGGLPVLGSAEIGGTPLSIRASGSRAFLATSVSGGRVEMRDLSDPSALSATGTPFSLSGLVGLDIEGDTLHAISASGDALRILESD
jgi:Tfp pilus assembly protein PilE